MATMNQVGTTLAGQTGTGKFAGDTSPTFVTPVLGAATATSLAFSPTSGGIIGTNTNDSVAAGYVGEIITASVTAASATAITSTSVVDITSISLTAGEWLVVGNGGFNFAGLTGSFGAAWISTTSATLPDGALRSTMALNANTISGVTLACPNVILQLSGTTTVYLSGRCVFSSSTATRFGSITATRIR